MKSLMKCTAQP